MTQIEYRKCDGFSAEVIRTRRKKTASIKVDNGIVSVIVPKDIPEEFIDEFLSEKTLWIQKKIKLHQEMVPIKTKLYASGEPFLYLGNSYPLHINFGTFQPIKLHNDRLVMSLPYRNKKPQLIKDALIQWYKQKASEILLEKVECYTTLVGAIPKSIKIKSFKSRWGGCNSKGDIDFNWIIMMAPDHIIDYVVVHELCHLKQFNHSKKFWYEVEQVIPNHKDCRKWLRDNTEVLEL